MAQKRKIIVECTHMYVLMNSVRNTLCYYQENQVFGGVDNRDMSLIKTSFCSDFTVGLKHTFNCGLFYNRDISNRDQG